VSAYGIDYRQEGIKVTGKPAAAITTQSLFLRIGLATLLCAGCIVAIVFFSIEKASTLLLQRETSNLFTAIESGPTQFANLNSKDFSDTQLSRLMDQVSAENPYYSKVAILSGQDFSQAYASWTAGSSTPKTSCLRSIERTVSFPNALFPFKAVVTLDGCHAMSRFRHVSMLLALAVCAGFVLFLCVLFYLLAPIFSSIRAASRLVSETPPAAGSGISRLQFLPVRVLTEQALRARELEKDAALARMMQMMAHDIRKPFTMLKMAFEVVSDAKSIDQARDLSKMMMPEVLHAMNTANGMIQDVMEFSSRANLQAESVSIRKLLKDALRDCFSTQPEADVQLSFEFGHSCQALIDEKKVARVLSNIVTNAIQAMQGHGSLIVSTTDVRDGRMLRLSVTNLGSFIEETDREHLFESFFTKGKKEGTGLGLAICKKIVEAHGGEIWVESGKDAVHPSGFVTFHFTLPMGTAPEHALALPNHSSEFGQPFSGSRELGANAADAASLDNGPPITEAVLKSLHDGLAGMASRKLRISLIDDEAAYREGLKALVAAIPGISDRVEVVSYESCPIDQWPSDLIVMDVDMGAPENGFEATHRMRADGSSAFICIHSNRILSEDLKRAVEAGADTFLSKPMTLEQMTKVLAQSAQRMSKCQSPLVDVTPPRDKELIVVFVEDSITFRTLWKHSWKMGHLETYGRPEDCIEAIRSGTLKPDLVVTDFHFGRVSPMTGLDLARTLQGLTDAPVVLASDGMFEKEDFAGEFRGFIAKAVPTLEQLRTLLPAEKAMLVPTPG
jgi:signal transduction histidine kinase